ncbi:hypothetical protein A5696_11075 [Mycobacterium sp. E2699]|uniref:hypothetical protein n=1 Tax=Mycobacterium sp. E2699 TaxID=1834137 RepID=UPI0007FFE7CE|nr:hypothetical protein [Mycobacterium sp. E2699]OBH02388.1 hypothetical protein A5696_11075 [Mycobacterium sp. E2699]
MIVNHHADHEGFSGAIGLVAALGMLATGRGNARFAAELASVSGTDRVVDIGCGPGNAGRAAVRPGAKGLASHGWTEQQVESFAAQCRAAGFAGVQVDEHRRGRGSAWAVQAVRPDPAT